jgi:hypothetical protein
MLPTGNFWEAITSEISLKLLIYLATPAELPRVAPVNDLAPQTHLKAQPAVKGLFAALTNLKLSNLLSGRRA